MYKPVILWLCLLASASCGYAQLGQSYIGVSTVGVSIVGKPASLGISDVAVTACNATCPSTPSATGLQLAATRKSSSLVALSWYTLTETNAKGFTVQRSFADGQPAKTLVFKTAKGNSSTKTTYTYTDTNTYTGTSYYWVLEQGVFGDSLYSNTVTVTGTVAARMTVYPNPATSSVSLRLPEGFSTAGLTISLLDASGREVYKAPAATLLKSGAQLTGLSSLKAGTYVVVVRNKEQVLIDKLNIAR